MQPGVGEGRGGPPAGAGGGFGGRCEGFDELFGSYRPACRRIAVARIGDERRRDEFRQAATAGAAGDGSHVCREAPAGVKGLAVAGDSAAAEQGFEAGERRQGVDGIDAGEQRRQRGVADDGIGVLECGGIGDGAVAQLCVDVRVRLEQDEGGGFGGPDTGQQVGHVGDTGAAEADRAVVADLAGDEDDAAVGRQRDFGAGEVVFGDAGGDDAGGEGVGAGKDFRREGFGLQQVFEIAGGGGIIIEPARIDDDRAGRDELGAKAGGADEAILDLVDRDVGGGGGFGETGGGARGPGGNGAAGFCRKRYGGGSGRAVGEVATDEVADAAAFPQRDAGEAGDGNGARQRTSTAVLSAGETRRFSRPRNFCKALDWALAVNSTSFSRIMKRCAAK